MGYRFLWWGEPEGQPQDPEENVEEVDPEEIQQLIKEIEDAKIRPKGPTRNRLRHHSPRS
jgi:hypothetical protein